MIILYLCCRYGLVGMTKSVGGISEDIIKSAKMVKNIQDAVTYVNITMKKQLDSLKERFIR